MFAICVESSHKKGMGHFYRALNFIDYLIDKDERFIFFINDNNIASTILDERKIQYEVVDLNDYETNWESTLVKKYHVDVWINDRLNTDIRHSKNICRNNVKLITFDDNGDGAELVDINFLGLEFKNNGMLKGKKVLTGINYLILNKEISKYQRLRIKCEKVLVTLGGSDTYGVTVKVVSMLKKLGKSADIFIGPSFKHEKELKSIADDKFYIRKNIHSLIEAFSNYDLAITGGGITPFEANASGLPCIIVANEYHEIKNAQYLEQLGSSRFIGYHEDINKNSFNLNLDIKKMSEVGIQCIHVNGVENIYNKIKELI